MKGRTNVGGGGGAGDAYKTVKVGSTNITASGADTIEFVAGTNITLSPDASNKKVTINSTIPLVSIAVTTAPTTTEYTPGETLDLTGIVVTATYLDNTTSVVTNSCTFSPADGATLSESDTSVSISYTEAGVTKTTSQAIDVSFQVYGVEWDGTSTSAFTRTDKAANFTDPVPYYATFSDTPSSPFDTIQPWAGMVRSTDENAGELVAIPKYYYKWTQNGSALKLQISASPFTGSHVSPAHMNRGDGQGERDVIYVGRYMCDSNSQSATNVKPYTALKATHRTGIAALDSDVWQWDFATLWTIMMLYLVEYADWDSQAKIGKGCKVNPSATDGTLQKSGSTDNMPYHTGTSAANRTTMGEVQYRNIEGLWSNKEEFVDGLYVVYASGGSSSTYYVQLNPSLFDNSSTGTEIDAGSTTLGMNANIKTWFVPSTTGLEWALLPKTTDSGGTVGATYVRDTGWIRGDRNLIIGGGSYDNNKYGMFYMAVTGQANGEKYASRLMKLPSNS